MANEERLHYMDALRATAMFLGLVIHAAVVFALWTMDPLRAHVEPSLFLHHVIELIHVFRMELFFMVAGLFSLMVSRKRGLRSYFKNRCVRIGVPFLLCVFILQPWLAGEFYLDMVDSNQSRLSQYFDYLAHPGYILNEPMPIGNWFWHFWFLHLLICYVVVFIGVSGLVQKCNLRLEWVVSVFRTAGGPGTVVLLTLITYPVLLFSPPWADVPGIGTSLDVLLYYGLFFSVGVMFFFDYRLLEMCTSTIKYHVIPFLIALFFLIPLIDELRIILQPEILLQNWSLFATLDGQKSLIGNYPFVQNPFNFSSLHAPPKWHLMCLLRAYTTWCAIFCFIALFKKFLSKQSALARYLADSSYFIYLIHFPIQLCIARFLRDRIESSILCFVLVLCGSLVLCFVLYHLTCRATPVGVLLSGRKYPLSLSQEWSDVSSLLRRKALYGCLVFGLVTLILIDRIESRKEYKLLYYSFHANPEMIEDYINENRDKILSDLVRWDGRNALHMASCNMTKPRPEDMISRTVALLLENGFEPDKVDDFNLTALHYAVKNNNQTALKQLLQAGADPNISESAHGNTPLHYAATLGDVSAIKNLVAAGADAELERKDGANAIELFERFHAGVFPGQ